MIYGFYLVLFSYVSMGYVVPHSMWFTDKETCQQALLTIQEEVYNMPVGFCMDQKTGLKVE